MRKQTNGARLFKLNFLAYWNTLFVKITKSTIVKQSFLLAIDKEEDISKLDCCSFILESLKRTRQGWKKSGLTIQWASCISNDMFCKHL
ncbi:hypothetical protein Hanom_Chr04g00343231 [Helianthus anomalus]